MKFNFEGVIGIFVPMIVSQLQNAFDEGLDNLAEKNAKLHKTLLIAGHVVLKEYGETLVADTTNTYDDKAVAAAIVTIEENAAKHGIVLGSSATV